MEGGGGPRCSRFIPFRKRQRPPPPKRTLHALRGLSCLGLELEAVAAAGDVKALNEAMDKRLIQQNTQQRRTRPSAVPVN